MTTPQVDARKSLVAAQDPLSRESSAWNEERAPNVAMVAGEASGDLLAGLLLDGMKTRWPSLKSVGIGGPDMARRGFQAWWPSERLAVRGYIEVLRRYREIIGIRRQIKLRLLQDKPDIFIGVDAPDFNLALERDLKNTGIKTVHFVCPSIWAWRPERVHMIKAAVDHVLCIFPFEVDLLHRHGIAATYVGHPLAKVIPLQPDRTAARERLALAQEDCVVALMPGSRETEIHFLAERFLEAGARMLRERPQIKFLLPTLPALRPRIERFLARTKMSGRVQVLDGQSHDVLAACDVALIASGTATLEAALFKRPMVIAYAMNWLTYRLIKRKQLQPWIGLPNILCQEFVVPELLQHEARPERLASATLAWLDQPERVTMVEQRFSQMHAALLRDTSQLAANAIAKILAR